MFAAPVADGVGRNTLVGGDFRVEPEIHLRLILAVDLHIAVQILYRVLGIGLPVLSDRHIGDGAPLYAVVLLFRPPHSDDTVPVVEILMSREKECDLSLLSVQRQQFPVDGNIDRSLPIAGALVNELVPDLLVRTARHKLSRIGVIATCGILMRT